MSMSLRLGVGSDILRLLGSIEDQINEAEKALAAAQERALAA